MAAGRKAVLSAPAGADGNTVRARQRFSGASAALSRRAARPSITAPSSTVFTRLGRSFMARMRSVSRATGQTIVNVPDSKIIRLYVDDEPLDLSKVRLQSYERALDMRTGTLDREIVWEKHSGKVIRVRSRRIVSFVHRHMAAILYEVTLLKGDAPIVISSQLNHILGKAAGSGRSAGHACHRRPNPAARVPSRH